MRFAFFTDIHLLENQDSQLGFEKCLEAMLACEPELLINGGDLGVTPEAVELYRDMIAGLPVPVHLANGNHEMCNRSLAKEDAGKFSRSFDRGGVHFVILDVVRYFEPTEEHPANWHVVADQANLEWLEDDLAKLSSGSPVVFISHVPIWTTFPLRFGQGFGNPFPTNEVDGADRILHLLDRFEHAATLHGHDHENCRQWAGNLQVLTTGAVAGSWWRNGLNSPNVCGEPQGFRLVEVDDPTGRISSQYLAFQPEQNAVAGLYRDEERGENYVNVFDASNRTRVFLDGDEELERLDPLKEECHRLSPHFFKVPERWSGAEMTILMEEDGKSEQVRLGV